MRTTLDIDRDVLEATREMAARTKRTAGKVISDLVRKALTSSGAPAAKPHVQNGFEVLPAGGRVVTKELVRKLKEESEDA